MYIPTPIPHTHQNTHQPHAQTHIPIPHTHTPTHTYHTRTNNTHAHTLTIHIHTSLATHKYTHTHTNTHTNTTRTDTHTKAKQQHGVTAASVRKRPREKDFNRETNQRVGGEAWKKRVSVLAQSALIEKGVIGRAKLIVPVVLILSTARVPSVPAASGLKSHQHVTPSGRQRLPQ